MHTLALVDPLFRRASATTLAGIVTAALFLLMHTLIATELPELESTERIRFDAIMPPPKPPELKKTEPAEKPQVPEQMPEWNSPAADLDYAGEALAFGENFTPDTGIGDIDPGAGSSTIVPVFRIAPDYPASALRRGIEGYVDLIFDVAPSGKTENIRVLAAEPEGVFERAATATLAKWKYKAPVQDGIPYGQKDMTTRISFRLEQ